MSELSDLLIDVLLFRLRNRSRNWIFIIFQRLLIPIPIQAKINFFTVLESIPGTEIDSKSDIYDSDSSKKRTYNTSTCCPKVAISLDRSDCRFTYLSPYFTQRPFIMSLLTVAVGLLVWSKGYENLALHVARCEIHATFRDD